MPLNYMSGFGGSFETQAVAGALPVGQNSPQQTPFGLFAEQLSGSAFTAPRHENKRSWLYRLRPTASHSPFQPYAGGKLLHSQFTGELEKGKGYDRAKFFDFMKAWAPAASPAL